MCLFTEWWFQSLLCARNWSKSLLSFIESTFLRGEIMINKQVISYWWVLERRENQQCMWVVTDGFSENKTLELGPKMLNDLVLQRVQSEGIADAKALWQKEAWLMSDRSHRSQDGRRLVIDERNIKEKIERWAGARAPPGPWSSWWRTEMWCESWMWFSRWDEELWKVKIRGCMIRFMF